MRKIYKYEVRPDNPGGITSLSLTHGSIPLKVAVQDGKIVAWFEVMPARLANWHVELVCRATGQEWEESERGQYIGTALLAAGALVFHVYLRDT